MDPIKSDLRIKSYGNSSYDSRTDRTGKNLCDYFGTIQAGEFTKEMASSVNFRRFHRRRIPVRKFSNSS